MNNDPNEAKRDADPGRFPSPTGSANEPEISQEEQEKNKTQKNNQGNNPQK